MALRTAGVGAERKLQIWDQYGVKRYDFSPSEMTTPGEVTFEFEKLLLSDTDVTPVGAVLLKVLDQKLKLRNAADDADVILDEVFIPHTLASEFTFTNLVTFARPGNLPSVMIGAADDDDKTIRFNKRPGGDGFAFLECEDEGNIFHIHGGVGSALYSPDIRLVGVDASGFYNPGCLEFRSSKSLLKGIDYNIKRLTLGVGLIADATWADVLQSGLKLKDALDANSQKITNLLDPTAAQDGATKTYVDAAVAAAITGLDWQESVLDKDLNTPPGVPGAGDRYIVAAGGTDGWTGHDDEIAEWDGAAWVFAAPTEGFACEVEDEDLAYVYDGAAWVLFGSIIAYGDDVFATFGGVGKLGWDTADPNANLFKVELPTGGVVDVPVLVAGIGIVGVDLTFFNGLSEPVTALVDIAKTSWVSFGFGAAATPELNCGGVAAAIRLGVPFDMNGNKIGGLDAPVAQDDALRKQRAEIIETDVDVTEIEVLSHKNVLNGYCPLDGSVLVPLANIPTPLTGKDADTVDGVEGADIIVRGGTVAFTGDQDMGGKKLTGLGAPVAQDDALRKQRAEIIETDVDVTEIEVLSHKNVLNGYCPLDASVLVPLANIPATLTGKDADTVDGADVGILVGDIFVLGVGGLIELARIPTPLTGKDADTVDGVEGADIIVRGGTVAFTADQPMGGNKLTGLGAPTVANDALRKGAAEIVEADVDPTSIEVLSHKGAASGYCGLDAGSLVALANIPTPLTGKDADSVDGKHVGVLADTVFVLGAGGLIELARIPTPLTGKDADTVDGVEGADIIVKDGSVAFTGPVPMGGATDLTIVAGVITVTKSFHKVDTEGLAATDDLDRIEGGAEGDILVLEAKDSGRTVVCKDGINNLWLGGSADFSLDNAIDTIMLIRLGGNWHELSRSNNAA